MGYRRKLQTAVGIGLLAAGLSFYVSAVADPPVGFLEGRLKIVSIKEVELAGARPSKPQVGNYADFPLVVLNRATQQQVARITPDQNGAYKLELPAGDYTLNIDRSRGGNYRVNPQSFTVSPQKTVRVDMEIDTGVR